MAVALALCAGTASAAAPAGADLRRAVALLDYVAGDYGRAVSAQGSVLSPGEYEEQRGFVRDAAREVRDAAREVRGAAGAEGEDAVARLDALAALVDAKAAPAQVSGMARALRDEIAQRFKVALLPLSPPQLARGAALYAQSCAACHGAAGHPGAAAEALGLSTRPLAFAVPAEVAQLSPQRAFSAATYGVPQTSMPAFDDAFDDQARWDLAFYVLSLAHPQPDRARGLALSRAARLDAGFRALAGQSDDQLRAQLAARGVEPDDREAVVGALRAGPFEEERSPNGLAQTRREIAAAVGLAQRGDREGARRAVISAYLDRFEPSEAALRARDPRLVERIESGFLALRQSLDRRADPHPAAALAPPSAGGPPAGASGGAAPAAGGAPTPEQAADALDALLDQASRLGTGSSGLVAFLAALAIALREGVEAALLVGLLLALLRKSDRGADARAVHLGWAVALLAGGITWWASGALLRLPGASRELTEGLLQLATAALLLYASHWVLAATHARKLVGALSSKALSGASAAVLFWLAFGAVYREMFEAVIFLRGLLFESPRGGRFVLGGISLGLALLALLVFVFQGLGRKLKLRPLLVACGILLCGLAVVMVGNGVHALQETGLLPLTVWGRFQFSGLGIYPTREGILAQAAVLAALAGSALWTLLRPEVRAVKDTSPARA